MFHRELLGGVANLPMHLMAPEGVPATMPLPGAIPMAVSIPVLNTGSNLDLIFKDFFKDIPLHIFFIHLMEKAPLGVPHQLGISPSA